ncbi:hypothetical protein CR513_56432, partial [Mucuna pruriens]
MYISSGDELLSYKLFSGTLRGLLLSPNLPPIRKVFGVQWSHDLGGRSRSEAFQKGLRADPFNESLALSRLASMTEI